MMEILSIVTMGLVVVILLTLQRYFKDMKVDEIVDEEEDMFYYEEEEENGEDDRTEDEGD